MYGYAHEHALFFPLLWLLLQGTPVSQRHYYNLWKGSGLGSVHGVAHLEHAFAEF